MSQYGGITVNTKQLKSSNQDKTVSEWNAVNKIGSMLMVDYALE